MNNRALAAEAFGAFMLVASILGSAFYSFGAPAGPAGIIGVAFSIGITVAVTIYAIGHISGGHYNPAVTLGLVAAGRFEIGKAIPYIIAQVIGGLAAAGVFSLIGHTSATFAANGYGELSMLKATLPQVFIIETVLTAFFLVVIVGVTRASGPGLLAPLAIGLALTAIHLMSIPISNTSVNPVRSFAPAVFAGGEALSQVWLFWVAPILGGVIGGLFAKWMLDDK
ncbi:porin [Hyphomicrobium methylovorum]|uniref:aquaporin n=1 Tax=Hyphomicrobium methylovorum TaxID=84 RepID=UPI0015E6E759|nr:aquaporin [Hyphomicrobium methylovorum]MBA2127130.1 porin [Hyphomicrobium methylovorum]